MSIVLIFFIANSGVTFAATKELTHLVLSKTELSMVVGDTVPITTTGVYTDLSSIDLTADTSWTSSDSSIASVYKGAVTAVGPGTVAITATYTDSAGNVIEPKTPKTVTVKVTKKVVALTTKNVQRLDLALGQSDTVNLFATFSDGLEENVSTTAEWTSGNTKVATVVEGYVQAHSAGTAVIKASYGGQSITLDVNVGVVKRLQVKNPKVSLLLTDALPDSELVELMATNLDGSESDVTLDATWTSSDPKVADMVTNKVTAYGIGTATLTANYGTQTATFEVEVDKTRKLVVSEQNVFLSLIDTSKSNLALKLEAIYPDSPTVPVDITSLATWTTSDKSVAYVNKGVVYAEGTGSATITAKYGDETVTVQVDVDVPRYLNLVEEVGMKLNTSEQLTLMADYAGAISSTDVASKATWKSSDASVVYVSNTGMIHAYKKGEATISAAYGGITVETKVSVEIPTSIALSTKTLDIKKDVTENITLIAEYDPSISANVDLTTEAEWSTSDEKIVEITDKGQIKGVATGTATITALYEKTKYTMVVNVGLVKELVSASDLLILTSGESKEIVLTANDASGNPETFTGADVTWKSSNSAVASVKNGIVKGIKKGNATITAEYGGQKVTVPVEVDIIASIEASHQSVSLKTIAIASATAQIQITVTFSDGSTKDVTDLAEWKTTSYKIATVKDGTVTAVSSGKTKVTAKYAGKSISIPVDVDTLKYLETNEVILNMSVGEQATLIGTATYMDGLEADISKAGFWKSSKILAATVKDGKVKATGKGKATITLSYGGKNTKVVVVVK
ncbi:hypothetical protein LPB68_10290 [Paenibacillus crassostreae]|nr:hypothetical protein LPB68_10290 [Paenibacillus crassostreae]